MKLKRFKETDKKKIGVFIFTIVCVLLVSGVVLYRTFAVFEVRTNQNVIKGTVQDPGNLYFAFYQKNVENGTYEIQKDMPKKEEGYMLDKENSYCGVNGERDEHIIVTLDRDTWSIVVTGMTTSRTKCNLYFKKTYDNNTLYDLSGNNYNGTFRDGAKVQRDEDGALGIYFDGDTAYVQVAELPSTIDWANGFTVEGEFKVISIHSNDKWQRIYDFGGGQSDNNILMAFGKNTGDCNTTCVSFSVRYDNTNRRGDFLEFININEKINFIARYEKLENQYSLYVTRNQIFLNKVNYETSEFVKNVTRTSNFLGMSNWETEKDRKFNGYIYSLKFTDSKGNIILWYDF